MTYAFGVRTHVCQSTAPVSGCWYREVVGEPVARASGVTVRPTRVTGPGHWIAWAVRRQLTWYVNAGAKFAGGAKF